MNATSAGKPAVHVWLVDDDDRFRERLETSFRDRGVTVRSFGSGSAALEELARKDRETLSPTHAVVDLRMPEMDGLALVDRLSASDPAMHIVVLTGYGSISTALEAVRRGASHYLTKPASLQEILQALGIEAGDSPRREDAEARDAVPSLARAEWEHIQRVLTDCGGNITQAAKLLGLHRRSLQRKLSKYPVSR